MTKIVTITSTQQLDALLSSSKIVIVHFQVATNYPVYEELATHLTRKNRITFTTVNSDQQQRITQLYRVNFFPTFKIFKNAQLVETIEGADQTKLSNAVKKIAAEADGDGGEGGFGETSASSWLGATLAKGYRDVTDQVDVRGLDLMNSDSSVGASKDLFSNGAPSTLGNGKGAADKKDWVESDTDEQMMLFIPFQSTLKLHSLHITSLKSAEGEEETMRPKTIRLYKNRAHTLGFDEAEDIEATQTIELDSENWDEKTGTAKIELRFVKFQNITSLILFVVDGDGDAEKTRIDRIRLIGESGEKRDMGKLEKIGDGAE